MQSPKSRAYKEKKESSQPRRRHKNKKFYNSKEWRETREAYLRHYRARLFDEIPTGKWQRMDLRMDQVTKILSIGYLPCEKCLKFYAAGVYDEINEGIELDHIEPVNPENATDREAFREYTSTDAFANAEYRIKYEYGDPFSFNNLQLLCKKHHAKKSQRENKANR